MHQASLQVKFSVVWLPLSPPNNCLKRLKACNIKGSAIQRFLKLCSMQSVLIGNQNKTRIKISDLFLHIRLNRDLEHRGVSWLSISDSISVI